MSDTLAAKVETVETWIGLAEAARLLPSHRPGKRVHLSTIFRWIMSGKIRGRKRGRWWFCCKEELLSLMQPAGPVPEPKPVVPSAAEVRRREEEWVASVLQRAGI